MWVHRPSLTANQLHSSLFAKNDSLWAPRQANQFTHTFKLSHELNQKTKISITNQHSLSINQNTRTLQIVGFDAILAPGFQFDRSLNLDNATTYTHHSNLTAINVRRTLTKQLVGTLALGRLFTNLRADANGRPFRTESVDQVFDEQSIVTDPVQIFNPPLGPLGPLFRTHGTGKRGCTKVTLLSRSAPIHQAST